MRESRVMLKKYNTTLLRHERKKMITNIYVWVNDLAQQLCI